MLDWIFSIYFVLLSVLQSGTVVKSLSARYLAFDSSALVHADHGTMTALFFCL